MFKLSTNLTLVRLTLTLLLVTFLSPSLGWNLIVGADAHSHADEHRVSFDIHQDHHHEKVQDDPSEHLKDAHTSIGHVLTHTPAGFFQILFDTFIPLDNSAYSSLYVKIFPTFLAPPLPPPR